MRERWLPQKAAPSVSTRPAKASSSLSRFRDSIRYKCRKGSEAKAAPSASCHTSAQDNALACLHISKSKLARAMQIWVAQASRLLVAASRCHGLSMNRGSRPIQAKFELRAPCTSSRISHRVGEDVSGFEGKAHAPSRVLAEASRLSELLDHCQLKASFCGDHAEKVRCSEALQPTREARVLPRIGIRLRRKMCIQVRATPWVSAYYDSSPTGAPHLGSLPGCI